MVCRLYLYYENARDFGSTINEQQIYFEQIIQDIFLCQDLWDDLQEGIIQWRYTWGTVVAMGGVNLDLHIMEVTYLFSALVIMKDIMSHHPVKLMNHPSYL